MTTRRVLIQTYTSWCGEDLDYKAIVDDEHMAELESRVNLQAYDNFNDFNGPETVREELFPNGPEDGSDWSDEQNYEADDVESDYFGYNINDFEGTEEEWGWYELLYDCTLES